MHIGLLEDNPAILYYLQMTLKLNGHHVSSHTHGASFLEALFAGGPVPPYPYDLVIIDLNLPGELSGWDVLHHIRKSIPPEKLPVIVASGVELQQLQRLINLFPDVSFIQKPFKMQRLLEVLETSKRKKREEIF